ncbi:MAG: glycosyltransferase family 4 protein, partial [SAR324 cluster bacterium]|nr:glycosyltransferase family 4 protein [SAR324 cluster bacterium]
FFDGRLDGIGRVSHIVEKTLRTMGLEPQILSANDSTENCPSDKGIVYGRNYSKMISSSLTHSFLRPKLIVCMHLGLAPVARIVSQRYGVPYFVFLHGIEAWQPLNFRRRWGVIKASRLLSNSKFTLHHFQEYNPSLCHIPADVIPLGIGTEKFETVNAAQKPQILIVGRMDQGEQYKGHQLLIQSLGLILEESPASQVIIVGDGDDRKRLEQLANRYSYRKKVSFLGKVSDLVLSDLYKESMIFAMPSKGEGFGLVYLEAMAHGLPCICSDVDAAREVVLNGNTGFAINPTSPFDFAERVLQLIRIPQLRTRMGNAGKARYLNNYTEMHFQTRLMNNFEINFFSRQNSPKK